MNIRHAAFVFALLSVGLVGRVALAAEGAAKPVNATARAADGLTIAYDVRGSGDTALVFIHGWCGDREFWKNQLDNFAGDYRVVAVDLAGHGKSGKDRKQWTIAGLAEDVKALVEALGLKRVILVGHSMGGPVSLAAAPLLPGRVALVVGVDTLHNADFKWPEEQSKVFLKAFAADFKGTLAGALQGMLREGADPQLVEWITTKAQSQDQTMALGLMEDMSKLDMPSLFKNAKVPVRCINAAPGFIFAIPTNREVNKKYADFDAVIIEGVGHFPMLEKPDEFNQKLRETLKEFAPKK